MRLRQRGMSLIEIMVAVVIALIGILIITQAYIIGDKFNRSTIGESGSQTNGLLALYAIERDVRNSGYGIADVNALGCGEMSWFRTPNYSKNINAGSPLPRIFVAPAYITTAAGVPDQISVLGGSDSERMVPGSIRSFTAASNQITLETTAGFSTNDFVLLVNASGCTMVQVTNVQAPPSQVIEANAGTYNPAGWGGFPVASYTLGNLLFNLGAAPTMRTFSIANGKLVVSDALTIAAGGAGIDLMDGIVDLRAQYGKDNGANNGTVSSATFVANDGQVDQFSSTAPANSAEWQQVLSLRIGVLARIGEYEKPPATGICDATTAAPAWAGGTFSAVDIATPSSQDRCYRYRVFETTVPLRNMIWRSS